MTKTTTVPTRGGRKGARGIWLNPQAAIAFGIAILSTGATMEHQLTDAGASFATRRLWWTSIVIVALILWFTKGRISPQRIQEKEQEDA